MSKKVTKSKIVAFVLELEVEKQKLKIEKEIVGVATLSSDPIPKISFCFYIIRCVCGSLDKVATPTIHIKTIKQFNI